VSTEHGVVVIGDHSGVSDCKVYSVGCSGIRVSGGDAHTLTHGHSFATGNSVRDIALHKRTYQPGIFWNGVGNNYSFNNITNSPHNCVSPLRNLLVISVTFLTGCLWQQMRGGGNEAVPWGNGWDGAGLVSGLGSECHFEV